MKFLIFIFFLFTNITIAQVIQKDLTETKPVADPMTKAVNTTLERVGAFDAKAELKTISNYKKNLVFIGMLHIGRKEFYSDVERKIDSFQKIGYFVFYELVNGRSSNDSLKNEVYKKKVRKIMGVNADNYYDTINKMIGGKFKYEGEYELTNQPKPFALISNMDKAKNADVTLINLIDQFEFKYGTIELNDWTI